MISDDKRLEIDSSFFQVYAYWIASNSWPIFSHLILLDSWQRKGIIQYVLYKYNTFNRKNPHLNVNTGLVGKTFVVIWRSTTFQSKSLLCFPFQLYRRIYNQCKKNNSSVASCHSILLDSFSRRVLSHTHTHTHTHALTRAHTHNSLEKRFVTFLTEFSSTMENLL